MLNIYNKIFHNTSESFIRALILKTIHNFRSWTEISCAISCLRSLRNFSLRYKRHLRSDSPKICHLQFEMSEKNTDQDLLYAITEERGLILSVGYQKLYPKLLKLTLAFSDLGI